MREAYSSPRVACVFTDPRNGKKYLGNTHVSLFVYDVGDDVKGPQAPGAHLFAPGVERPLRAQPVSHWRSKIHENALRADPPPHMAISAVDIPESVLDALPPDANVELRWTFAPEADL